MLRKEALGLPRDLRSSAEYGLELIVIGVLYVALARVSLSLASINPSATPIWPTTGFALAIVMLRGFRVVPAIFAGALAVNIITAGSIYTSLGIATGNALESLVGAYLINEWSDGLKTFDTPAGVAKFALIVLFPSAFISATLGVGSLTVAGYADWSEFRSIWTTWWIGDFTGALVLTPVIVLWAAEPLPSFSRKDFIRSGMVYATTIAVGILAFSPLFEQTPARTSLAFLVIFPLMWAAIRRNQRDTASNVLLLSCFAVWGTMAKSGPFFHNDLNDSFLLLLAANVSISFPSLALSAEAAVRRRHEEHVEFVMHELSHRSKNLLAIVQSMANQIGRHSDSFDMFFRAFSTRLRAFADTHDLLVNGEWRGVNIRDLVRVQLQPFHDEGERSIAADGPDLTLTPKAAEQLGLALHELGTNAAKHGALMSTAGMVKIGWRIERSEIGQEQLRFSWKEVSDSVVEEPKRDGFGKLVITRIVPATLLGTASLEFEPDGVKWVLLVPATSALAETSRSETGEKERREQHFGKTTTSHSPIERPAPKVASGKRPRSPIELP